MVPKTTGYRTHAAEHVLSSYSFKSLHAPQLQRIEALSARWALGGGLVYDRSLSKQELRRGDYPCGG